MAPRLDTTVAFLSGLGVGVGGLLWIVKRHLFRLHSGIGAAAMMKGQ